MKIRHTTLVGVGTAAIIAAMASGSEAQAADVVIEKTNDWGCYVGVFAGYGTGEIDISADLQSLPEDGKSDLGGGMVGGLVGCDYSIGNGVLLGLTGDLSWSDMDVGTDLDSSVGVSDYSIDAELNWLGTARAKVGFELGDAVVYGTGGLAFAGLDHELNLAGSGNFDGDSGTQLGWTLGAGISYMASDHLMLGIEYLYVDLGEENYDFGNAGDADMELDMHIIRASISYRF